MNLNLKLERFLNIRALIAVCVALFGLVWIQFGVDAAAKEIPWKVAAIKGDAKSQYITGNAYAAGMPKLEIKKDLKVAFGWYMKAAEQNHAQAQYEVAAAYIKGEGVRKDMDQARSWLRRSASLGHNDAKEVLAGFSKSNRTGFRGRRIRRNSVPSTTSSEGGFEIGGIRIDPKAIFAPITELEIFGGYGAYGLGGAALLIVGLVLLLVVKRFRGRVVA